LKGVVSTKTLFRAGFEFKGKHSQHSVTICQKQLRNVSFVETLLRWSWKFLSHFVANLSYKTLHINFYHNWSRIV